MTQYAKDQWERAQDSLEVARRSGIDHPDSTASLSYYAAFHAANALFALRDQYFAKHTALRAAVHRDLIHGENWAPALGADFDMLAQLRMTGNYGGTSHVSPEQAAAALDAAQRILDAVRASCPQVESPGPA